MTARKHQMKKKTVRQLSAEMEQLRTDTSNAFMGYGQLLDQLNTILTLLLDKMDLLDRSDCECGFKINIPLFVELDSPKSCPQCGKDIENGQTTLDEFSEEE